MENYIIVNGKEYVKNASLKETQDIIKKLNLKLIKSYTFKMKHGLRRVLRFEAAGKIYSVLGLKHQIDAYSHTRRNIYFGFDENLAYSLQGEVHCFDAKDIDFSQPNIKRIFEK